MSIDRNEVADVLFIVSAAIRLSEQGRRLVADLLAEKDISRDEMLRRLEANQRILDGQPNDR